MADTLVVLEGGDPDRGIERLEGSVTILSFHPDPEVTRALAVRLEAAGVTVESRSAAGLLDDVALFVRERFADLIAAFPQAFPELSEGTTFRGELSLWWLAEISGKRSDRQPTFTRLCQLEVLRRVHGERPGAAIHVLSADPALTAVVAAYASSEGVGFSSAIPPRSSDSPLGRWGRAVWCISTNLVWFIRTGLQAGIARLAQLAAPRPERGEGSIFFSHYPSLWRGTAGAFDEKYGRVPEEVEKSTGRRPVLLVSFSSDGRHQSATMRAYLRRTWWFIRSAHSLNLALLDAHLTPGAFLAAVRGVFTARRYARVERDPRFAKHWRYEGIPIAPLVREEFWLAARRIPRYLLVALQVRRYIQMSRPRCFITYLFEFCYGRAIVYGARSARTGTRVIGVQHGPFAKRKLITYHRPGERPAPASEDWIRHFPTPDHLVVEGTGARDRLLESGFDPERIDVAGAPRLRALTEGPRIRRKPRGAGGPVRVLVAFGQHDVPSMVSACAEALRRSDRIEFHFRLHPRTSYTERDIEDRMGVSDEPPRYTLVRKALLESIAEADVVLGTYSSVVMEAAILGVPVVCLQVADRVNTTPVLDEGHLPGIIAARTETLADSLIAAAEGGSGGPPELLQEYFFGPADRVEERWAEVIVRQCAGRSDAPPGRGAR